MRIPNFGNRRELRVGAQRSHTNFATEFCCERTLISMIDGKSYAFLQTRGKHFVIFQLFGTDTRAV